MCGAAPAQSTHVCGKTSSKKDVVGVALNVVSLSVHLSLVTTLLLGKLNQYSSGIFALAPAFIRIGASSNLISESRHHRACFENGGWAVPPFPHVAVDFESSSSVINPMNSRAMQGRDTSAQYLGQELGHQNTHAVTVLVRSGTRALVSMCCTCESSRASCVRSQENQLGFLPYLSILPVPS